MIDPSTATSPCQSKGRTHALERRAPKYPLPVALIGRLAVDVRAQRRGLGADLLVDALRRVLNAASIVGCVGVIVDAKDEAGVTFYSKFDFAQITEEGWPRRMFLPIGSERHEMHCSAPNERRAGHLVASQPKRNHNGSH